MARRALKSLPGSPWPGWATDGGGPGSPEHVARMSDGVGLGYQAALLLARRQGRQALGPLMARYRAKQLRAHSAVLCSPVWPSARTSAQHCARCSAMRIGEPAMQLMRDRQRQPRDPAPPLRVACLAWCGAQGRSAACCSEPASSRCRTCAPHQSMCCTGLTRTGPATRQLAWQAW